MRSILALATLVGCGHPATPKPAANGADADDAKLIAAMRALPLEAIEAPFKVRASRGASEHAHVIAAAIGDELVFYREQLGLELVPELFVLGEADWKSANPLPYGLAFSTSGVIGMPAKGGVIAELFLGLEATAPQTARDRIAALGKTWPQAVDDLVDLIGYHEAGHLFEAAYGIAPPSHWVDELVASYFAYAFMRARRPELADVWDAMADASLAAMTPEHRSLADFEKLYFAVGIPSYAWYEQVFLTRVQAILPAQGVHFLEAMKRAFPRGAPPPSEAEAMARLERVAPGIGAWAASLSAPAR